MLTLNLDKCSYILYYLRKIISAKTRYKTYYNKYLVIVKTFKTWEYYPKKYKYKVLILIKYKNLHYFINIKTKSLYRSVKP